MPKDERRTGGRPTKNATLRIKATPSLSVRDIVIIVAGIVTLVLAWGVERTRISLIEKDVKIVSSQILEIKQDQLSVIDKLDKLEDKIHAVERASDRQDIEIRSHRHPDDH